MGNEPFETARNMDVEARIREEIKRKLRAGVALNDSETCDNCHKPFPLHDVTFVETKFICTQCQVSQVDPKPDAVIYSPQNIAIPSCPVLRTNDVSDAIFFTPMPKPKGMKEEEVERTFHRNGRVFQEVPFVGGEINGVIREWHRNGILAKEVPMKGGVRHGICKQWNDKGELLGTFEMSRGTGISKQWFQNGQIEFEASIVDEKFTGRMRRWDEDGTLVQETFFQGNRMLSTEDYQSAIEADPSLPSYAQEVNDETTAVKGSRSRRSGHERIIARLLSTRTANATEWLNAASPDSTRTLGKLNAAKSAAFLAALREAGAIDVLAVDIDEDRAGNQSADKLVVVLPTDQLKRQAIRKYCTRRKFEMSPENEAGDSYLAIFLG